MYDYKEISPMNCRKKIIFIQLFAILCNFLPQNFGITRPSDFSPNLPSQTNCSFWAFVYKNPLGEFHFFWNSLVHHFNEWMYNMRPPDHLFLDIGNADIINSKIGHKAPQDTIYNMTDVSTKVEDSVMSIIPF